MPRYCFWLKDKKIFPREYKGGIPEHEEDFAQYQTGEEQEQIEQNPNLQARPSCNRFLKEKKRLAIKE